MDALEQELAIVEAMVSEIETYLTSAVLFWPLAPIAGISPAPLLTIGSLLLRIQKLIAGKSTFNQEQNHRFEQILATHRTTLERWSVHVEERVRRELNARLNSWNWFVDDCDARKRSCIHFYPAEAELRILIELLIEAGGGIDNIKGIDRLKALDARFSKWFNAGDFILAPELASVFPKRQFWWLYGRPRFRAD